MGCDFSRIQAAAGESDRSTQISDLCILNVKMPFFSCFNNWCGAVSNGVKKYT